MKTIKFQQETAQDPFYQYVRQQVQVYLKAQHLSGYATPLVWGKALLYSGLYLALYLSLLFVKLSFENSLFIWALLGVLGILIGLNIAHDAAHDALSANKRLNKWIYRLSFSALGANAYLWQLRHVQSHHLFPNVDDCDADIDDNPIIRLSPHKPLYWYHRWQFLYAPVAYLFYTLIWIFVKDWIILKKKRLANLRDIRHPKAEIWRFFAAKIAYCFYLIALPVYCMDVAPWQVLIGFVLMHFVQSYAFIFSLIPSHFSMEPVFSKVDAHGYLAQSWARHQVAASLDYHETRHWANFIFGGFNAHVAHHLFPQISHVHYPAISVMIQKATSKFNIPYHHSSLPAAIISHFRLLKALGKLPPDASALNALPAGTSPSNTT